MIKANVFNIERFATEDGKGIRTVIFLKGCALRCRWCANPESQSFKKEVLLNTRTCIGCGKCSAICPQKAISLKEGFGYITNDKICTLCGTCEVLHGEVHVLLGENGAGKSTLIKILSGAYKKEEGKIILDNEELNVTQPKQALDKGISVIYQEFNLVPHQPIYENIYIGKEYMKNGMIDKKKAIDESKRYMNLIGLDLDPRTLVCGLSVAQKQMVEIAKAISNNVKLLVLDEPTAAITDKETKKLFEIVRDLKSKGIGIIYISHRMSELFEIGDRCTVMRDGQYVSTVKLSETNVEGSIIYRNTRKYADYPRNYNGYK